MRILLATDGSQSAERLAVWWRHAVAGSNDRPDRHGRSAWRTYRGQLDTRDCALCQRRTAFPTRWSGRMSLPSPTPSAT